MSINREEFNRMAEARSRAMKATARSAEKEKLRESLDEGLAKFLAAGGEIKDLSPTDTSRDSFFNDRNMTRPKTRAEHRREEQPVELASAADLKKIKDWTATRKGRGKLLCEQLGKAGGYISQLTSSVRPCSKEKLAEIHAAMEIIEKREQMAS